MTVAAEKDIDVFKLRDDPFIHAVTRMRQHDDLIDTLLGQFGSGVIDNGDVIFVEDRIFPG